MFRLIVLGTGMPMPVGVDRAGPSALVVHQPPEALRPRMYLIDAGRWVSQRLIQTGLPWPQLDAVLFTHHHMDHNTGWPDVLMTGWQLGRQERWQVYGPRHTDEYCRSIEAAFEYDRPRRHLASTDGAFHCVNEIGPGVVLEQDGLTITCAEVPHGDCKPAFAFRFDVDERSIVISGDCSPSRSLIDLAQGADVLLHEVCFRAALDEMLTALGQAGGETLDNIVSVHTTETQVGVVAREANASQLVLTHFIPPVFDEERLRSVVADDYDGPITIAADLTTIDVAP